MKKLYCSICGCLTAKLEKGSSVHPKAIMICGNCNDDGTDSNNTETMGDSESLDFLKNMFGFK